MKRLLLTLLCCGGLLTHLHAQTNTWYERQWLRIDSLVQQSGRPQTALRLVDTVYAAARRQNNEPQLLRALYYRGQLRSQTREANINQSLRELRYESAHLTGAAAAIGHLIKANYYYGYTLQNIWKIRGRSTVAADTATDLNTWDLSRLLLEADHELDSALAPKSLLQQVPTVAWAPLLQRGTTAWLRPTLYDLIAQRALELYANSNFNEARPERDYTLNARWVFAEDPVFVRGRLDSGNHPTLKRLRLYQELTRLHLSRRDAALLDVLAADRLSLAYAEYDGVDKDSLYVQALRARIAGERSGQPAAASRLALANWYRDKANRYMPLTDSSNRYANRAALETLAPLTRDSAVSSYDRAQAANLAREIRSPEIGLQVERVNLPGQPFRYRLLWNNLSEVYFRVIAYPDTAQTDWTDDGDLQRLMRRPAQARWKQELPATGDFQAHSAEGKVDALPIGRYLLVAGSSPEFVAGKSYLAAIPFSVSGLGYLQQEQTLFVVNRSNGQPVAGAQVTFYKMEFNSHTYRSERTARRTLTTDAQGMVKAGVPADDYGQYQLRLQTPTDFLSIAEESLSFYRPGNTTPAKHKPKVYFFTDRGLYRPGQTVYLKGLLLDDNGEPRLLPADTSSVVLQNANGKEVARVSVRSNEFGSFRAQFTLPAGGLTGRFSLSSTDWEGSSEISVEEYKRPKFEVRFDTLRAAYRLGDTVTISGSALAYAGNAVNGGMLRYRVLRTPQIPYFYRYWYPVATPVEIAHGTTQTDAGGLFSIRFPAHPDPTYDSASNTYFSFNIIVDVTDQNGETRSGSQTVRAGYTALLLDVSVQERMPADSFRQIPVSLTNTNGEARQGRIDARIYTVQAEQRLIRPRLWEAPDLHLLPLDSFLRYFPNDPYDREDEPATWPLGSALLRWSDTLRNGILALPGGTILPPGFYELELETTDSADRAVHTRQRLELTAPDRLNRPVYFEADARPVSAQPGNTVQVQLQSSTKLYVWQLLQRPGSKRTEPSLEGIITGPGSRVLPIAVREQDRGGIRLLYATVRDGRIYTEAFPVAVPWSNKELQVSLASFRDKTLPGSREQWRVTVRGPRGDEVAAELLAGLYDASLDQLSPFAWKVPAIWPTSHYTGTFSGDQGFEAGSAYIARIRENEVNVPERIPAAFLFEGDLFQPAYSGYRSAELSDIRFMRLPAATMADNRRSDTMVVADFNDPSKAIAFKVSLYDIPPSPAGSMPVTARRNFDETAFFFPQLQSDSAGGFTFSFTLPDALTRWKFQGLAHSKDLAFGLTNASIVTQKDLMVQPNLPRFLRQGDHLELVTKVVNLTGKELTGQVQLELFDAATGTSVDGWFQNVFPNQYFTVAPNSSEAVAFPVEVPYLYNSALTWRVTARSGDFSDAEEASLPILGSKVLVTETLPLPMRGTGTKTFTFDKLLQSGGSETLQQQSLTLEYTPNPAWQAVQALPYLIEYPYECAEQTWNRYYANALAAHILQRAPKVRAVLARWQQSDTAALLSNLDKNPELKSALLEETPWVLDAANETEQRKNIALLFNLDKLATGAEAAREKLLALQLPEGAFPWFAGGPPDRYITEYILAGIGRLQALGAAGSELNTLRNRALRYGDAELQRDYNELVQRKTPRKDVSPNNLQVLHLYARSFTGKRPDDATRGAFDFYLGRLEHTWQQQSKREQGMSALALWRYEAKQAAANILQSLRETALRSEELGMYWKEVSFGRSWHWQDAPIETQSVLIEAFAEAGHDTAAVNDLRTWLLKNKQANHWRTTTATADACYALLLRGSDWISKTPHVVLTAGPLQVSNDTAAEAGSGYFRKTIPGAQVRPDMGRITVQVSGANATAPSWGAAYWQYFEDMDKVTSAASSLSLQRRLFKEVITSKGKQLEPVTTPSNLHVGDRVHVRLVLRTDRPMEYVHLKDLRPSCLEPTDVLSGYRWQDGLGYYQATRDLSTNFFITALPAGTYVLEYSLFVTNKGDFSAGMATAQCLYAPEFSAHSEGQRVSVE